jgi:deaminated glutathione amidase
MQETQVLFLPEASDYIASNAAESLALAQPQSESPFVLGIQEAAKKHSVAVNVGIHVPVPVPDSGSAPTGEEPTITKLLNRSLWVDADGAINQPATYDKLHLFDYGALRESATVQSGTRLTAPFPSPVGRIGSLICFDLRFPEPALALAQPAPHRSPWAATPAQLVTYPSAFTIRTGIAHWEVLLRARAVETQSWVIAAAQVGRHNERRSSYGHSMAVDPWGRVMLELGGVDEHGEAEEGAQGAIGFVDIDLGEWKTVREQMPLLRRT